MQTKSRHIYNLILIFAKINQNENSTLQKFAFFKLSTVWRKVLIHIKKYRTAQSCAINQSKRHYQVVYKLAAVLGLTVKLRHSLG